MEYYYDAIGEMARDFVGNYKEELETILPILENAVIKENKDAEKDNDYIFDRAIYQKWDLIDKIHKWLDSAWYGFLRKGWAEDCKSELASCVRIIDESEELERDNGLWEGQEPTKAIQTQAFFTAKLDLQIFIEKLIKEKI